MQQQQAVVARAQLAHASNIFGPCSDTWMSTQHGRGAALLLAVLVVLAQPFTGSSQAPKPKDVIPLHLGPVQVGQREGCREFTGATRVGIRCKQQDASKVRTEARRLTMGLQRGRVAR